MRRLWPLFILSLVFLVGCDSSDLPATSPGTQAGPAGGANPGFPGGNLVGKVVSTIAPRADIQPRTEIVASLADPGGGAPVPNARVLLYDLRSSKVLAETTTDQLGAFRFENVQGVQVHLVVTPLSGPPVGRYLTLPPGSTVDAGESYTVEREQASSVVRQRVGEGVRILASQNPLPAGTVVTPAFEERVSRRLEAPEWLFFVDLDPGSPYEHPVLFLFVDAQSGNVVEVEEQFYPSLNGYPVWNVMLDARRGLELPSDQEEEVLAEMGPDLVQAAELFDLEELVRSWAEQSAPLLQVEDPEDRFALLWRGTPELPMVFDLRRMKNWCIDNGIPEDNIVVLNHDIDNESFAPTVQNERAIEALAERVEARRSAGGHPALFVYGVSHGFVGGTVLVLHPPTQGRDFLTSCSTPVFRNSLSMRFCRSTVSRPAKCEYF